MTALAEPRTETRVGGPWTRRTEAAQAPRLPQLYQRYATDEDIGMAVASGEIESLVERAIHDDSVLVDLATAPAILRRVLELVVQYDAQADWFCRLAERQQSTIDRLQVELASERAEVLRLQELDVQRCADLTATRDQLVDAAAQVMELDANLTEARASLLQLGAQVAVADAMSRIPPARDDFGDTESYPSNVRKGTDP